MRKLFTVAATFAVLLVVANCAPTPHGDDHHDTLGHPVSSQDWADFQGEWTRLKKWLGVDFQPPLAEPEPPPEWNVLDWMQRATAAICELEDLAGVDPGEPTALCKTPDDPDDEDGPPPSPPWE